MAKKKNKEQVDYAGKLIQSIKNTLNWIVDFIKDNFQLLLVLAILAFLYFGTTYLLYQNTSNSSANKFDVYTSIFAFWQGVFIIITTIYLYFQNQNKIEAEFEADIELRPMNYKIPHIESTKTQFPKLCLVEEYDGTIVRTAFDIYPALRKKDNYPLFRVINRGKVMVENLVLEIKCNGTDLIREEYQYQFKPDTAFQITTGDKYRSFMSTINNFEISLQYYNPYTKENIKLSYEAQVFDGFLYFVINKKSKAWKEINSRTIPLEFNEELKFITNKSNSYKKESEDWNKFYDKHKSGVYPNYNKRYLQVDWDELGIDSVKKALNIESRDDKDLILIKKRGVYIRGFKLLSK